MGTVLKYRVEIIESDGRRLTPFLTELQSKHFLELWHKRKKAGECRILEYPKLRIINFGEMN